MIGKLSSKAHAPAAAGSNARQRFVVKASSSEVEVMPSITFSREELEMGNPELPTTPTVKISVSKKSKPASSSISSSIVKSVAMPELVKPVAPASTAASASPSAAASAAASACNSAVRQGMKASTTEKSVTFQDIMSFGGSVPELTNSRLAMLGFVAAMAAEFNTGEGVLRQMADEPTLVNITFLAIIAASLAPAVQGKSAEKYGPFTPDAEIINGRVAMIGFAALLATEVVTGTTALDFFAAALPPMS